MAVPELTLLGKFTNSNANTGLGKAANTTWSPPAVQTTSPSLRQGMLNTTEVGEVLFMTVEPAEDATGTSYDLPYVQLVLDGEPYDPIVLDGGKLRNMAPRPNRLRRGNPITFGLPTLNPQGKPNPWFQITCPKFTESVVPQVIVGSTAVEADYTIYIWGYIYDATWLASEMPMVGGSALVVPDPLNDRELRIPGYAVAAKNGSWRSQWKTLPGGPTQGFNAGAQLYKLVRRARNSNATTASQAYNFQYMNSSDSPAVARARQPVLEPHRESGHSAGAFWGPGAAAERERGGLAGRLGGNCQRKAAAASPGRRGRVLPEQPAALWAGAGPLGHVRPGASADPGHAAPVE